MKTIYGKKCLIDTNVLVAARIRQHPDYPIASGLFSQIQEKTIEACISIQNITEFSAVLIRAYHLSSKKTSENVELASSIPSTTIIYPNRDTIHIFSRLLSKYEHIYVYDLYLLATALSNGVEMIISGDRDFSKVKEIGYYNPFAASKN